MAQNIAQRAPQSSRVANASVQGHGSGAPGAQTKVRRRRDRGQRALDLIELELVKHGENEADAIDADSGDLPTQGEGGAEPTLDGAVQAALDA